ncbi:hypothetical protein BJ165DRAFT_308397 [Panaeolus papilionaceus]|nr:hypothetical protein BJ165DRAFT_308397 [Panaeolus papilionaceus]
MSSPNPSPFAPIRRIVTTHDSEARAVVQSDQELDKETMPMVPGAQATPIWATMDGLPTDDNNCQEDGALRPLVTDINFGLVPPNGTNLRSTELPPGGITPMHRTSSLDYNILVAGELILILDDGNEVHLKNPGDVAIQKGTMHAWKNPSSQWARWITVLVDAKPAQVNGTALQPDFVL